MRAANGRKLLVIRSSALLAAAIASVPSITRSQTWLSATSSTWSNAANWTSMPVSSPVTSLNFAPAGSQTYIATDDFAGGFSFSSLTFNGTSTGSVTVAAGSLSSFRYAGASPTITNVGVGPTYLNGAGSISGASTLTINAGTTTNGTTLAGPILGAGGLVVNNLGAGAVTIAAGNTFAGGTTLNSGLMLLGAQSSLGTGSLVVNGGALGTTLFPGFVGAPPLPPAFSTSITLNSTLTIAGPYQYSLTGSISGVGGITFAPNSLFDGVWTLAGANSFAGPITVNPSPTPGVTSTLVIAQPQSLGNAPTITLNGGTSAPVLFAGGANPVAINATLVLGSTGGALGALGTTTNAQLTVSGNITGSGSLNMVGNGYTTLTGVNAFAGALDFRSGTTIAGADSNIGGLSTGLVFSGGSLVLGPSFGATNRPVTLQASGSTIYTLGDATFNGVMTNSPAQNVAKAGSGRLNLTAPNPLNNVISVNGGTLAAVGASGAINTAGSINVAPGAAVVLDNTDNPASRMGAATAMNLYGGSYYLIGNGTQNTAQVSSSPMNIGQANQGGAGYIVVSVSPGPSANARASFSTLPRTGNNGTQVLFTGLNIGSATIASNTPNASNVSFTSNPTLQNNILPWAIADATGGPGSDFATNVAGTGIRPLSAGSYSTVLAAGSLTQNVAVGAAVAPAGTSLNALKLTGGQVDVTTSMQIGAGALLATGAATINGGSLIIGTATTSTTTAPTFNVFAIADLIINSRITNFTPGAGLSSGLAKAGNGVLTLAVSNSYTGPTYVHAGTLRIGNANAIPGTSEVFVNPGATLDLNGNSGTIGSLNQTAPVLTTGNNINGTVIVGAASLTLGQNDLSGSFAGDIVGNGNIFKRGVGTLVLTGNKSFTGSLTIGNGAVELGTHVTTGTALAGATRINIGSASLDAESMLAFSFGLNTFSVPITTAAPTGRTATIKFINGPAGAPGATLASAITLGPRGVTIDSSGPVTLSGQITGTGTFVAATTDGFLAAGPNSFSLNITGTNLYTGPTVLGGLATLWGNISAFGSATSAIGLGNPNGADNPELSSSVGALTLTRGITVNDSLNAAAASAIIGSRAPANSGTTTYSGAITIPGQRRTAILYSRNPGAPVAFTGLISGGTLASVQIGHSLGLGLEFINSNVTLTNANTYPGGTTLVTGTLNLASSSAAVGPTILSGPVGTGTFTIGTAGSVGSAEPTVTAAGAARSIANPVVIAGNFSLRGANSLTLNGAVDLSGGARVINVDTSPLTATLTVNGAISGAPGSALVKDGAGTLVLSAANSYAGPTAVMGGTLVLNAGQQMGGIFGIGPGASAIVSAGGSRTVVTPAIQIDAVNSGRLDMNDNELIVDYTGGSPIANITALLTSGYAAGAWTGSGIASTTAAGQVAAPVKTALGVAEATDLFTSFPATFAGQSIDSTAVLVRYTVYGDATLDGSVDTIDFNLLTSNFSGSGKRWSQADFNYDGSVDTVDFNLLASNFSAVVAAPASRGNQSIGVAVPEPAAGSILVGMLGAVATRRRLRRA